MNDSGDDEGRATPEGSENGLGLATRPTGARRRALLAAFAAVMAFAGLAVPGSGCLNPRPEELPSSGQSADEDVATPVRETCEDNPLLAGCGLPEHDNDDSPIAPEPAEPPSSLGGEPDFTDENGVAPAPGAAGAGGGGDDAGADDTPADAGAP